MEECYNDLFIAIWAKAFKDDIAEAISKLSLYALSEAYTEHTLNTTKPLEKNSAVVREAKKAIYNESKELCERLVPRIRELVYMEMQKWPNNRRVKKDPEYDRIFGELKKEALAFARGEILKISEEEDKQPRENSTNKRSV